MIALVVVNLYASCDGYFNQVNELVAEAKEYADNGQTISQANTMDRVKYYVREYLKCVDKEIQDAKNNFKNNSKIGFK